MSKSKIKDVVHERIMDSELRPGDILYTEPGDYRAGLYCSLIHVIHYDTKQKKLLVLLDGKLKEHIASITPWSGWCWLR